MTSAGLTAGGIGARSDRPSFSERLGPYYKYFLLSPLIVMLLGFFAGPLLWLFRVSLYESRGASGFGIGGAAGQEGGGFYVEGTWTLDGYIRFFADDYFRSILGFTVEFALLVTVVTMVLAYPMAYYIYKAGPKLKVVLLILVILPKLSNMLVLVYGLQIMLANNGIINKLMLLIGVIDEPVKLVYTLFSMTVSKVLLIIPYTILVITATLHGLDPTSAGCGEGHGRQPGAYILVGDLSAQSARHVRRPADHHRLGARCLRVAGAARQPGPADPGGRGAEADLRERQLGHGIGHRLHHAGNDDPGGAALQLGAQPARGLAGVGSTCGSSVARRSTSSPSAHDGVFHPADDRRRDDVVHAVPLPASADDEVVDALVRGVLQRPEMDGGPVEQHDRQRPDHRAGADRRHDGGLGVQPLSLQVEDGALHLALTPVFTPAVIIAMALLTVAYKLDLWGGYLIIAISHSLWAFPLVIMILRVSLEGLDRSLEEAARGMGASQWRTFREIILPLVGPSVLVGALFAFIISINEFIMALFLGTSETETLPRIIYPTLRYRLTPLVAAASGVLMLLTVDRAAARRAHHESEKADRVQSQPIGLRTRGGNHGRRIR